MCVRVLHGPVTPEVRDVCWILPPCIFPVLISALQMSPKSFFRPEAWATVRMRQVHEKCKFKVEDAEIAEAQAKWGSHRELHQRERSRVPKTGVQRPLYWGHS